MAENIKPLKSFGFVNSAFGQYRWQILILSVLGVLSGFLESVGISAVIPLLSFVVGEGAGEAGNAFSRAVLKVFAYLPFAYSLESLLFLIAALFIMRAAVMVAFSYLRTRISSVYTVRTMNELLKMVLNARWSCLLRQKLGYAELTLTRDVRQSAALLEALAQAVLTFSSLAIYIFAALSISFPITALTAGAGAFLFFLLQPLRRGVKSLAEKTSVLEKEIGHFLNEHTLGAKAVKSAAAEKEVFEKGMELFRRLKAFLVRSAAVQSLGSSFIQPLSVVFIFGVFLFFYRKPEFQLGSFVAIIYLIQKIFVYTEAGQSALHSINDKIPYAENVINFRNKLSLQQEAGGAGKEFKFASRLEFKDVSFSYDGERKVLDGVNFAVARGEMLGLFGSSGAGKTSVADLILRLFVPTGGEILLDGANVNDASLEDWRRKVGYVSQDMFLLNDTVLNNIKFYRAEITDEDAKKAARAANIYDFVSGLKEGFETEVGEQGVMLSMGQRQRIILARALAREPEILILDEATSALDNESEALIQKSLGDLKGKITIFVIAHRLTTLFEADRVLALENGRITESGAPQALLQNKNSYFYRLSHLKEERL